MIKKILVLVGVCLLLMTSAALAAGADVSIEASEPVYTVTGFTTDVTVYFAEPSLHHDRVYLSYHICDEEGNMLVFENQRIPFDIEEDGSATIKVRVVNSALPELAQMQRAAVHFDFVDEKNAFWFSYNPAVNFQEGVVLFECGQQGNEHAASATIVAVLICVVGVGLIVFATLRRRKTEKQNGGEKLAQPGKPLDFLNLLRAIGCICVVFSHYAGFLCGNLSTSFAQLMIRQQDAPRLLQNLLIEYPNGLGAAIFFPITGFLAARSLDKDSKLSFVLQKLVRIYPVYIGGLVVLYVTSILYTNWAGTTLPWGFKGWLATASLLRDWMWIPSVDGLGWSLEVNLKMYIVYFLLKKLRILEKSFSMVLVMTGGAAFNMVVAPYLNTFMEFNMQLYVVAYVLVFSVVFLMFGMIGIVFYNYYSRKWDLKESLATGVTCFLCFYLALTHSMLSVEVYLKPYTISATLFALGFLLRERIRVGRVMSFIAKISFSVYVLHALSGYYMMSVFDHYGVHPYLSLAATVTLCIVGSLVFYKVVEAPLSKGLRKLFSGKGSQADRSAAQSA